jgi:hypothetical protein
MQPIDYRKEAEQALIAYAANLNIRGYNKRSIQDSINALALDVILKSEEQLKERQTVELREEDKPVCFGTYGLRNSFASKSLARNCDICLWQERCYNSQRDS